MKYTNIPSHIDYKNKANDLFLIGLYQLLDLEFQHNDFNFMRKQKLSICNSLLQQCCELYLKSLLCKISPYLLIKDATKKDLVNIITKAHDNFYNDIENSKSILDEFNKISQTEKDFSECYAIEAIHLLPLTTKFYGENFFQNKYDFNFQQFYEKNRLERNVSTHSHSIPSVKFDDLLLNYISIFEIFNKNNILKFIYKNQLKGMFNKTANPINNGPNKSDNFEFSLIKKSQTMYLRYYLMRFSQLVFNKLNNSNVKNFFNLYKQFKKGDIKFNCPYCENYYRASHEDKTSILKFKKDTSFFPSLENDSDNIFISDAFFKTFYRIEKNSKTCKCIICGKIDDLLVSKSCKYCEEYNNDNSKKFFAQNKCLECGCSDL